jgi:hypothetical protein
LALPAIPPAARWWEGTGVIAVEGLIACSWGQPNGWGDRRRWSVGFGGIGRTSVGRRAHGDDRGWSPGGDSWSLGGHRTRRKDKHQQRCCHSQSSHGGLPRGYGWRVVGEIR